MGFIEILYAETRFVWAGLLRRKSALFTALLYPYILTAFVILVGSTMGSPQLFVVRVGIEPVPFFIVSSFMLMSIMGVVDDIFWKPLFDEFMGTLPYVIASPVDRVLYFVALPLPRLIIVLFIGLSSVLPVMIMYYGVAGVYEAVVVMLLAGFGALVFATLAMCITGALYIAGGETWRSLNVIRPLLMVLLGVFYPRWLMPLTAQYLSWALPPSHVVEAVHRMLAETTGNAVQYFVLLGVATALAILYAPIGSTSIRAWERKKLREGISV
ncbi:MAG: ABC transporter permease [Thermoprotei archaeon]|nr:MAG: ABC transporter permease [Thermoprotei archaeon]